MSRGPICLHQGKAGAQWIRGRLVCMNCLLDLTPKHLEPEIRAERTERAMEPQHARLESGETKARRDFDVLFGQGRNDEELD